MAVDALAEGKGKTSLICAGRKMLHGMPSTNQQPAISSALLRAVKTKMISIEDAEDGLVYVENY